MSARKVTIRGVEYTTNQAALIFGVKVTTINRARLNGTLDRVGLKKSGDRRAKNGGYNPPIEVALPDGRTFQSLSVAARHLGVAMSTLRLMQKHGRLGELCGVVPKPETDADSVFLGCRTTSTGPKAESIHARMAKYFEQTQWRST